MADIISLDDARTERSPHTAGECACLQCKHEWIGVVPTGVVSMRCPKCGFFKGVRKMFVTATEGALTLSCDIDGCGGILFSYVFSEGMTYLLCAACGTRLTPPDTINGSAA